MTANEIKSLRCILRVALTLAEEREQPEIAKNLDAALRILNRGNRARAKAGKVNAAVNCSKN